MNYLIIGEPIGNQTIKLIEMGVDPENIYVWEDSTKGQYCVTMEGATVTDNLDDYNGMRFDVVIGNPPYLRGDHLKFLIKSLEISDNVTLIHPASWLFRCSSTLEKQARNMVDGRVSKLEIFNGNTTFIGAQFGGPLVITTCVKEYTGPIQLVYKTTGNSYMIDSLEDMPTGYWEPTEEHKSLVNLFTQLSDTNLSDIMQKYTGGYALSTPRVVGHVNFKSPDKFIANDFFVFFYRNSNINTINKDNKVFSVRSQSEVDSLVSYLKTKVARFGLSIHKISQDLHINRYLSCVPLPPLDREWTDQSISEYYSLSSNQVEYIDYYIPDYY